jgi:hypothetical protein
LRHRLGADAPTRRLHPGYEAAKRSYISATLSSLDPPSAYKRPWICYCFAGATAFQPGAGRNVMAKGQMRSNKEKKKPKADKNLKKGGATPRVLVRQDAGRPDPNSK